MKFNKWNTSGAFILKKLCLHASLTLGEEPVFISSQCHVFMECSLFDPGGKEKHFQKPSGLKPDRKKVELRLLTGNWQSSQQVAVLQNIHS